MNFQIEGRLAGIERTTDAHRWVVVRSEDGNYAYVAIVPRIQTRGLKVGERVRLQDNLDKQAQIREAVIAGVWV